MSILTKEGKIILAIEAIRTCKGMSIRQAAKIYEVPESSIRLRMKGVAPKPETRNVRFNLTFIEEETIVRYILDMDSRGFPPRIDDVEDMANSLLAMRSAKRVGK